MLVLLQGDGISKFNGYMAAVCGNVAMWRKPSHSLSARVIASAARNRMRNASVMIYAGGFAASAAMKENTQIRKDWTVWHKIRTTSSGSTWK
jgi:hypothetical protein